MYVYSKPSLITLLMFQVMFETEELYHRAVKSNVLTRELVSKLYNVPDEKILTCMFVRCLFVVLLGLC